MGERSRAGLIFIFVTLLIDFIGIGLVVPVLPSLVTEVAGGSQAEGARHIGLLLSCFGIMQFLFAPVVGNLSDRFGRKPVLIISLVLTGLDYVLQAMAVTLPWLYVGRILAGLTGASISAATAYIADVTPPEKRTQSFGILGAAFALGLIIGPALGGILGEISIRAPFWAAATAAGLNALFGFLFVSESLPPERRRPLTWKSANPFRTLTILGRSLWVRWLTAIALMLYLAQQVPQSTLVLYTEKRFGWSEGDNGRALALLGLFAAVVQTLLIRFLAPRLKDLKMLAVGVAINVAGYVLVGLAGNANLFLAALLFWSIGFMAAPSLQSLISQEFDSEEQGAVQGAMASLQSLSTVLGPPMLTYVYAHFTSPGMPQVPGSPFFMGALLSAVGGALLWKGLAHRPKRPEKTVEPGFSVHP